MDCILSGCRGARKVVDAAISDTQLWYRLLTARPISMTSRKWSQQNGTAINAPWRGQKRRLAAFRNWHFAVVAGPLIGCGEA
jgi:hypothetical protein